MHGVFHKKAWRLMETATQHKRMPLPLALREAIQNKVWCDVNSNDCKAATWGGGCAVSSLELEEKEKEEEKTLPGRLQQSAHGQFAQLCTRRTLLSLLSNSLWFVRRVILFLRELNSSFGGQPLDSQPGG
jgi:hypothetical protein